jgi:hypothetical protein
MEDHDDITSYTNATFSHEQIQQKMLAFYQKYGSEFYDLSCIDLWTALHPSWKWLRSLSDCICPYKKDWIFCSELVAMILKDLNVWPSIDTQDTLPVDFCTKYAHWFHPFIEVTSATPLQLEQ